MGPNETPLPLVRRSCQRYHFAFAVELAERGIARDYTITEAVEDLAHARGQ